MGDLSVMRCPSLKLEFLQELRKKKQGRFFKARRGHTENVKIRAENRATEGLSKFQTHQSQQGSKKPEDMRTLAGNVSSHLLQMKKLRHREVKAEQRQR